MKKRVVAAVLGGAGVLASLVGVQPAQAAGTQIICNSKNSETIIYVYLANGNYYRIPKHQCSPSVPLGSRVGIPFDSYRVGYGGDYSECRPGARSFVPWQKAKKMWFRTYIDDNC